MGRTKKYNTIEEKETIKRQRASDYYWQHKDEQDEKARQRYYKKKDK